MIRLFFTIALLIVSVPAFAEPMMSGPIGALFFLFLTPPGWIILGALVVAVIVIIVKKVKKRG